MSGSWGWNKDCTLERVTCKTWPLQQLMSYCKPDQLPYDDLGVWFTVSKMMPHPFFFKSDLDPGTTTSRWPGESGKAAESATAFYLFKHVMNIFTTWCFNYCKLTIGWEEWCLLPLPGQKNHCGSSKANSLQLLGSSMNRPRSKESLAKMNWASSFDLTCFGWSPEVNFE